MACLAALGPGLIGGPGQGAIRPGVARSARAFARIVPLSPPPAARHASARPWARLAGRDGSWVWCEHGARKRLRVTLFGGLTRRCAAMRVTWREAGGHPVTWLAMRRGAFWARPLSASRGVVVRALGARGAFRSVALAEHGGHLMAVADASAPGAQAHYHWIVSGRRKVRMAVSEQAFYRDAAIARRDRPALLGFYDYGVGTVMPASALDPARHDADGLWLADARGHSWVPLRNPRRPWSQAYGPGLRAFGLLQRDRARRNYGAHAARLQDAPDVIVRGFGRFAHVTLRERPTARGAAPNVWVVFGPQAADRERLRYRLAWTRTPKHRGDRAIVVSTLLGGNARSGARMYVIDYAKGPIARRLPDHAIVGEVRVHPDTFVTQDTVRYNPYTRGYRQVLQLMPVPGRAVRVRAWLAVHGARVSEFWRYVLRAPRIAR